MAYTNNVKLNNNETRLMLTKARNMDADCSSLVSATVIVMSRNRKSLLIECLKADVSLECSDSQTHKQ